MLFKTYSYSVINNELLNTCSFGKVEEVWIVLEEYNAFKSKGKVKDWFSPSLLNDVPNEILNWDCLFCSERGSDNCIVILEPDLNACIERINNYLYPPIEDGDKVRLN